MNRETYWKETSGKIINRPIARKSSFLHLNIYYIVSGMCQMLVMQRLIKCLLLLYP
jgi:hypothetical protein